MSSISRFQHDHSLSRPTRVSHGRSGLLLWALLLVALPLAASSYAAPAERPVVGPTSPVFPTTTTLSASPNPAYAGMPITLTADVAPDGGPGTGTPPSGQVTFKDSATQLGSPVTLSNGHASMDVTLAKGTHTLTAYYGGDADYVSSQSVSVMETVNVATLVSIDVTPKDPTIPKGTQRQFTAVGTFSDGHQVVMTGLVSWTTGDSTVATMSPAVGSHGWATGTGPGTTTITATYRNVSGSTSITVTKEVLLFLQITPTSATIAKGATQQYVATGTYTGGSKVDVTQSAVWTSSLPIVATIDQNGVATAVHVGTTSITASFGGKTASAPLNVTKPAMTSLIVLPRGSSTAVGGTLQFTATAGYADGTTTDVTKTATWTSSDPSIATISDVFASKGLATALKPGTVTITAALNGLSNSTTLTVVPQFPVYLPVIVH